MRRHAAAAVVAVSCAASSAEAQEPRQRLELGASAGYAVPVGDAEQGSQMRDTAFGMVPFALDAAYPLTGFVGVAAHARYGVTVPTLCKTASDCQSSLGSDTTLVLAARFHAPRVWRLAPFADLGLGYEWLTTRFTDAGATSTRSYGGPVLLVLEAVAPFKLGERWTVGPVLGASAGVFTSYDLRTNALSPHGDVGARSVHGWLSLAFRIGVEL